MNKYKNGKIYKIISQNTDMIYIGSTTRVKLKTRMNEHRFSFNHNGSMESRDMFLWDDAVIKLIEDYPCETKTQLTAREQYYMDLFPDYIVNKRRAVCDREERKNKYNKTEKRKEWLEKNPRKQYYKEWYEKNKEKQLEKCKQYRQDYAAEKAETNRKYRKSEEAKEKRRANDKIKKLCECCNKLISKGNFHTHKKTKIHLENMRKLNS